MECSCRINNGADKKYYAPKALGEIVSFFSCLSYFDIGSYKNLIALAAAPGLQKAGSTPQEHPDSYMDGKACGMFRILHVHPNL